ncbi:MAG: membrane protein insertase YidC [Myxococcota bacterium]|jgi:YidC/Oxa1 family membrane protein insertase|nr:membrane protein insertase YidC [Myxococcota bacterium]
MEPTNNRGILVAIVLSVGILILWQFFFAEMPEPSAPTSSSDESEVSEADTQAKPETQPAQAAVDSVPTPTPSAQATQASIEAKTASLQTDHFSLTLTNVGARALQFELKEPDRYANHGDYLAPLKRNAKEGELPAELPLATYAKSLGLDETSMFELVDATEDQVKMRWTSLDGRVNVEKTFSKGDTDYAIKLNMRIENRASERLESSVALSLYGYQDEDEEPGFFSPGRPIAAKCLTEDDVEDVSLGDDPEEYTREVKWIAVDESYFAFVARPLATATCSLQSQNRMIAASLEHDIDVPPMGEQVLELELYLGPKEDAFLNAFGHDIDRTIDYGWVEILAKPIAWLLRWLHSILLNWGLAIIALTVLIRGLLWPITQRSQDSMMRMRDIQPQLKEIQEKYKSDPQRLQTEQMALFRKHNVSPFGCLPLLLQIPIWFALYRTIYVTGGLYHAEFALWIHDLSAPDPYYILPIIAGALFVLQQKLSPTTITDVRQKVILTMMPLVFVVVMLFLPAALNLYMLVSSVVGLAQLLYSQHRNKKRAAGQNPPPPSSPTPSSGRERRSRKRAAQSA